MVKEIITGVLIFVLLVTTTGITYHFHYCGDTLMAFSILHTPKPCCEHPEKCCHDEATTLQLRNDFVFSIDQPDLSFSVIDLPMATVLFLEPVEPFGAGHVVIPEESPPPLVGLRLALLQQFLI